MENGEPQIRFGKDVVPIIEPPICTVVDSNNGWYVPIQVQEPRE